MTVLQNSSFKVKAGPIPSVGSVYPEPGAMAYSLDDGKVYIASAYGWIRVGETEKPFHFFFNFDGTNQLTVLWKAPSTSTVSWDWGNNVTDDIAGNDGSYVTTVSAYTTPGTYYIQLSGDVLDLTSLNINGQPGLIASINGLERLTNLTFLGLNDLNVVGSLNYLSGFTACEIYLIDLPQITGDASELANNVLNTQIEGCPLTTFSSEAPFVTRDARGLIFVDNNWSPAAVDNCIKAMVNVTNCNIHVHNNSYRSQGSDDAIVTLLNGGNTLTVDEAGPLLRNVGPELLTIPNAVSDPAGNEANGTSGWTATGLGSPNEFRSQSQVRSEGVRAFKMNANPVPTPNADIQLTTPVTVVLDELYRFGFDYRHIGVGGRWEFRFNLTTFGFYLKEIWTDWTKYAVYFKSPGTTFEAQFRERTPQNDGGIYVDNCSLKTFL